MLSPAEFMGLSGMSLAGRVRQAFFSHDAATLTELLQQMRTESVRRHVIYLRDGASDAIRLLPCPVTLLPDQLAYVHYVSQTIQNALKRLPDLYMQDPAVREALRITPPEEQWLLECWGSSHQESNPVFGRLDAVIDFSSPMWKESLKFVEPNMSGIGGLHLVPAAERIVEQLVFPLLKQRDPELKLEVGHDIRELLMQEVLDHADVIGRRAGTLCLLEAKYVPSGIDEQERLARYFHEKYGMKVLHADPAELSIVNGEVCYQGETIDYAYRDYSVLDLVSLQASGVDVAPMRLLMKQNRVVSSIAAELDQKACWEIFTDPLFTSRYFSPEERQVFRRHILWTRVVSHRTTRLPDGETGNLFEYLREERESLVLKPNRSYGGEGVLLGLATSEEEWNAALQRAVDSPERWVVQQLASIPVYEFPVLSEEGTIHRRPFYTVMGFAPQQVRIGDHGTRLAKAGRQRRAARRNIASS
ncbi:MAG: hypothetical protein U0992_22150 [Planctomycetaceae bacterium]